MGATIDDRVVSLAFDNKKFEAGVKPTLASLDKLKSSLKFDGVGKGFDKITAASKKTDLSNIAQSVESINGKFTALKVASVAVLASIATQAVQTGAQVVKSFTFGPIAQGFSEYENKLNSVQTILSNTKAAGTSLKEVNATLSELNTYADKTIYNFGQMTKNIGTFTAAGVDLKTATSSIKGISNLAALSGSNAEQASTAMYQLSQAISSGRVSLQDWNSVVNAGMGGTVFQRALAQTAVSMGEIDKSALTLEGKMKNVKIEGQSFRESIMAAPGKQSWLTSKVLTNTLKQFSGDLSVAELKAQGFNEAQIKAIRAQAKMALNAATQVKTFSQLIDTTKEAIGSGWADTFQLLFGDFGEAKTLFTGLSNTIGGFVQHSAKARNKILKDWKELGGRALFLESLKEAFHSLMRVLEPIKDAFRDIFPKKTGKDLFALTQRFFDFVQILKIGPETVENLRRIFRGFFAILDIGKQVLAGVWAGIKEIFKAVGDGEGGFLDFGASVGDVIVAFRDWLKHGEKIKTFFEVIGSVIGMPIKAITTFIGLIGDGTQTAISGMAGALGGSTKATNAVGKAWERVIEVFEKIKSVVEPVLRQIRETIGNLADTLATAIKNADFDTVFSALEVALTGGIFLAIKKALGKGIKVDVGQGLFANMSKTLTSFGGTLRGLSGAFTGLNGTLVALQNNIKANTLLQISIAIGILAASLTILSMIKPKKLDKAMSAVTVSLAQLIGGLALMGKAGGGGIAKLPVIAASLIALSTAIGLLSISLLLLSTLNWEELAKGLTGVGGLLLGLSLAVQPLSKAGPGMVIAGLGAASLGVGLTLLAGAVKVFSLMDWEDMGKGMAGVVASLAAIAAASQLISPAILLIGPGLIATGIGLAAVGGAVKIFASMDTDELKQGILGMAGALVAIGLAVLALPPTLPFTAAGLILVGIALASVGSAIALMGNMKTETLVKGIIAIGAALGVLALGLTAMSGAIPGTIALLGASVALAALVPIIGVFGKMPWGTLAKGIGVMVIAIVALGVAGTVAAPGLAALGLGLLALGAGVYLISAGLAKLGTEGGKGIAVALAAMAAFVAALPHLVIDFLKGLVEIIGGIAKVAPEVVEAMGKIAKSMAEGLIKASPSIEKAIISLVGSILKILRKSVPDLIRTGFIILNALLDGIEKNITRVTKTVVDIVTKFLRALADRAPSLLDAGADLIVALLKGVSRNIERVLNAGANLIVKFLKGLANNIQKVIEAGADIIVKILKGIGNKIDDVVEAGAGIVVGLVKGIGKAARKIVTAGVTSATKFVNSLANQIPRLVDNVASAVIKMMNKLADIIENRSPEFYKAAARIGAAFVKGIVSALGSLAGEVKAQLMVVVREVLSHFPRLFSGKALREANIQMVNGLVKLLPAQQRILNNLGKDLGHSFWNGLMGVAEEELDQTDAAFKAAGDKLAAQIDETKKKIDAAEKKRWLALTTNTGGGEKAFKAAEKAIAQNKTVLTILNQTNALMTKGFSKEKAELKDLTKQFNDVSQALLDAQDALDAAKEAQKQSIVDIAGQYSTLPDIITEDDDGNPVDQVLTYVDALKMQVEATKKYFDTLAKLKEAGLDDETYKKLVDEGVAGTQFAEQLLKAGPDAIAGINKLDDELVAESTKLAVTAAQEMNKVAVNAAQTLVDKLTLQQGKVYQAMWKIASAMVAAIKKRLRMKSPSQEFADIGELTMQGMAKGLTRATKSVTDAVDDVSKDALSAMRDSMKKISDVVEDTIDSNPTITPILDLSDVQNGSDLLKSMMNVTPITAAASYGQAASISAEQSAAQAVKDALAEQASIQFIQNNQSPESLSEIEIYRNTRNLLSQARPVISTTP